MLELENEIYSALSAPCEELCSNTVNIYAARLAHKRCDAVVKTVEQYIFKSSPWYRVQRSEINNQVRYLLLTRKSPPDNSCSNEGKLLGKTRLHQNGGKSDQLKHILLPVCLLPQFLSCLPFLSLKLFSSVTKTGVITGKTQTEAPVSSLFMPTLLMRFSSLVSERLR
jgi:hypothetical protein